MKYEKQYQIKDLTYIKGQVDELQQDIKTMMSLVKSGTIPK